jgi:quinol monooxygenase YgiN
MFFPGEEVLLPGSACSEFQIRRPVAVIYVIASIELVKDKRGEYLQELNKAIPLVRSEEGCLEYGPATDVITGIPIQEVSGSNVVTLIERWSDIDALQAHLNTDHMKNYFVSVADLVKGTSIRVLRPV